jgi:hypothetical protein
MEAELSGLRRTYEELEQRAGRLRDERVVAGEELQAVELRLQVPQKSLTKSLTHRKRAAKTALKTAKERLKEP